MLQVYKAVVDVSGSVITAGFMPFIFDNEADAVAFMNRYVDSVFGSGRCGFIDDIEGFWWGCDDGPVLQLHHFRIEMRGDAAHLSETPTYTCDIDLACDHWAVPSIH
jgi:hypothetical protein